VCGCEARTHHLLAGLHLQLRQYVLRKNGWVLEKRRSIRTKKAVPGVEQACPGEPSFVASFVVSKHARKVVVR
jgi:hypothetical protein